VTVNSRVPCRSPRRFRSSNAGGRKRKFLVEPLEPRTPPSDTFAGLIGIAGGAGAFDPWIGSSQEPLTTTLDLPEFSFGTAVPAAYEVVLAPGLAEFPIMPIFRAGEDFPATQLAVARKSAVQAGTDIMDSMAAHPFAPARQVAPSDPLPGSVDAALEPALSQFAREQRGLLEAAPPEPAEGASLGPHPPASRVPAASGAATGQSPDAPPPRAHGQIEPLRFETAPQPTPPSGPQAPPAEPSFPGGIRPMSGGGEESGGEENHAPDAEDDYYQTLHDTPLDVSDPDDGVLANDDDPDGDPFWAVLVDHTLSETFQFFPDGTFYYEPWSLWAGEDTFTYYATDGIDQSDTVTVTIDVTNNEPDADDDWDSGGIAVYETLFEVPGGGDPPDSRFPNILDNDEDGDGDEISVWDSDPDTPDKVDPCSEPEHGELTLKADGSFDYTPDDGYTGEDQFTYRATDGMAESNEATVSWEVVRPVPDIDTDFDGIPPGGGSGGSGGGGDHEKYEEEAPGNVIRYNDDDDNENGVPDREDTDPFEDPSGDPVNDDDLETATVAWDTLGADLKDFTFSFDQSAGSGLKVWDTADKQHELTAAVFTVKEDGTARATVGNEQEEIVLSDEESTTVYVEGYTVGDRDLSWVLKNPDQHEVHRNTVKFTVVKPNMTAYRPQTEGYDSPFPRTAIPWDEEMDPGVGIRLNGDDDDGDETEDLDPDDTAISGENDLIEVRLEVPAYEGIKYRLRADSHLTEDPEDHKIEAWGTANKSSHLHPDGEHNLVSGEQTSIWIEWVEQDLSQTDQLELVVYDDTHNNEGRRSRVEKLI